MRLAFPPGEAETHFVSLGKLQVRGLGVGMRSQAPEPPTGLKDTLFN